MINPDLKQVESAVRSFWFYNEQPQTEKEAELLNLFDPKGLKVYRRLLKDNWQDTLESIYPFSQKIIGDEWTDVIARYVKTFPPEHFNLNQLAKKFPLYLSQHEKHLPVFLSELADYEWLELEIIEYPAKVDNAQRSAPATVEDFLELSPSVNPTLSIRDYSFEIMEIAKVAEQDKDPDKHLLSQPSWVAAFRPPGFYYCRFLDIEENEAALLRHAAANPATYGELAKLMISRSTGVAPETASLQFVDAVERFHEAGIFV
jgi:hypothetical protein